MKPVLQRNDGTSIFCSQLFRVSDVKMKLTKTLVASSFILLGILIMVLAQ